MEFLEVNAFLNSKMNLEVKIVKGESVLELLNDKSFINQWEELALQCNMTTVIQEHPFVKTWYCQYSNKYLPILLLGFHENTYLVGLIPLAYSLKGHYLTHAGDGQAEYHGWICKKNAEHDFMINALIAIKNNFGLRKWHWRPCPPGSTMDWAFSSKLKKEKIYLGITEEDSPVLDLNDLTKIDRIRKNKSTQNQLNRYKKRDGFYIERITSREKAEKVFDILSKQCDLRQMASHRTTPFASDGNKMKFYLERLNFPEANHFTVLWADNIPVAFHFGAKNSLTVFNGLSSYNPIEEKNSPGRILIIKLIELLREEGFKYFDLTPGGDRYKERYFSFHQKIYTTSIYFFKKDKIISDVKYFLKKTVKKWMISFEVQPDIVKYKLNNVLANLKRIPKLSPLKILRKLVSILFERNTYLLLNLSNDDTDLNNIKSVDGISLNNYPDLLLYKESDPWINKTDLCRRALKHFTSEDILYTIVINGVLAQYGWIAKGGISTRFKGIGVIFDSPEKSLILYDFFTDPSYDSQELLAKIIERMLCDCRKNGANEVCIWSTENRSPFIGMTEKTGFKVKRKFRRNKIFWLVQQKELA